MVLGFEERCIPKILAEMQIHTIRRDEPDRWGKGAVIHFSTSTRTKNYNKFKQGECVSTQHIIIQWVWKDGKNRMTVQVDGRLLNEKEMFELAKNEGFDRMDDFEARFSDGDFYGKIIHWTDKKY